LFLPQAFPQLIGLTPLNGSTKRAAIQQGSPAFKNVARYYVLITEFQYEVLSPEDPGGMGITVYDLQDLTLASLFGKWLREYDDKKNEGSCY